MNIEKFFSSIELELAREQYLSEQAEEIPLPQVFIASSISAIPNFVHRSNSDMQKHWWNPEMQNKARGIRLMQG